MSAEPNFRIPYPGPRPFESNEQNLFFGRDREILELASLVTAHRVVLIYAQSGAGKTSLLNAGLIPALRAEGFEVLPVARMRGLVREGSDVRETMNIYVVNTLMSWLEDRPESILLGSLSISAFLRERAHPTDRQGLPLPRVIIFDQFEELFAFYPERWREREGFFHQVAGALEADPLLRVLFVMREDCLASLDPYARAMPDQLRNRFRLELLRAEPATLAVERPVISVGRSFASGVAHELVQELLKIKVESARGEIIEATGEFVEPVQLQVICQNLWIDLPPDTKIITIDHLKAFGNVGEALKGFYERAVKTTAKETRVGERDLRNWFERHLVTPADTRGTVFRGKERTEGIPNAAVDVLENQHLIRAELRAGARWYELTHDRFIHSIQISNEEWRFARSRRLARIGLVAGLVLFFIVMALVIYALDVSAKSTRLAQDAVEWSAAYQTSVAQNPTPKPQPSPENRLTFSPPLPGTPTLNLLATAQAIGTIAARELPPPTPRSGEERVIGNAPMMFVPAGEFTMGSNDGWDNEKPPHTPYLDAYWIEKFLVTNVQYRKCVDSGKCSIPWLSRSNTRNSYYGNTQFDDYPVIWVSWNDARSFCEWAGKRLPTEAEWEKAARGSDGRIYPWGDAFDPSKLNFIENGPGDTTAVGSFSTGVSPYGVMDMAGNVFEWVADRYSIDYYPVSPKSNPTGPSSGDSRVLRGGSWQASKLLTRSAYRAWGTPELKLSTVGFRCATR